MIALFWLAWSAYRHVRWIVLTISGVLFGMGSLLIFIMAILHYLTGSYQVFAASANGIASTGRCVLGALSPLAPKPMYTKLGIRWAGSLLAFLGLDMTVIPLVTVRYGDRIRGGSRFCQYLKEMDEEEAAAEEDRRQSETSSRRLPQEESA